MREQPAQAGHVDRATLEQPPARRRMVVVVNPNAACLRTDPATPALLAGALGRRYEVEVERTDAPGHATGLAGAAARAGADVVVTLGGDGTVNEAANALAGTGVPLFPLPGGSQNVYAKLLGIPGDLVDATEHLLALADRWYPRAVDLGRVNGRLFTFSAGVGLDADVVERVERDPSRKARLREVAYIQSATAVFLTRYAVRAPRLVVTADGGAPVEGVTAIVQNGPTYTFAGRRPIEICRNGALDSGTLSAAVLRRTTPLDLATMGARLWLGSLHAMDHRQAVALEDAATLTVRRADGTPCVAQADGEPLEPAAEVEFGVEPGALSVVA